MKSIQFMVYLSLKDWQRVGKFTGRRFIAESYMTSIITVYEVFTKAWDINQKVM